MDIMYHLGAPTWNPGFFCCYQVVVGFLNYCERNEFPNFEVFYECGLYYDASKGPNWWEYYFQPIRQRKTITNSIDVVCDGQKQGWCTDAISTLSREQAGDIIDKYIHLQPHVQQLVDAFVSEQFQGCLIIGVHYRGTDKSSEASRVSYNTVQTALMGQLAHFPKAKIFVATDEAPFIDFMKQHFKEQVLFRDVCRSMDIEVPVHNLNGGPQLTERYLLGEQAVVDCYLLARCHVLVRTQSNLSSSAANINPNLEIITLNTNRFGVR